MSDGGDGPAGPRARSGGAQNLKMRRCGKAVNWTEEQLAIRVRKRISTDRRNGRTKARPALIQRGRARPRNSNTKRTTNKNRTLENHKGCGTQNSSQRVKGVPPAKTRPNTARTGHRPRTQSLTIYNQTVLLKNTKVRHTR